MTRPRACGSTGATSDSPVLVRLLNDRKSSSTQLRGASGSTAAMNEPGQAIWMATYR